MNIGIFRNTALRCGAEHREMGCESPTQNGTVRCMFFLTAQQRGHSGETGEGFAERTGFCPTHQVRIFGSNLHSWLSQRSSMQCIKTFAPRFEKTLVLFYSGEAERYRSILYYVKNDGVYKGCRESR